MKILKAIISWCSIFFIILKLLVVLIILEFSFKLAFKGVLNVNLTHLLYHVMLPQLVFFRKVKIFPIKAI